MDIKKSETNKNLNINADVGIKSRKLGKTLRTTLRINIILVIAIAIFFNFGISFFNIYINSWGFYYITMALLLPFVFLLFPATKKDIDFTIIPLYDYILALTTFLIFIYFNFHALEIYEMGWSTSPGVFAFFLSFIAFITLLESARRTGGYIFFLVVVLFSLYPLLSEYFPGPFKAISFSFVPLISNHIYGSEGILGLVSKAMCEIALGFLVFATLLITSGAGKFFLDLAYSLAGSSRGGAAKIAVISSGFMGSCSGGGINNVITTGCITIPTMKDLGYPDYYAAAVETCASTGGAFMPPIMGTAAFVMSDLANIPYSRIIIAAFLPAVLYYLGILFQIDSQSIKLNLKGLPREGLPVFWNVLKKGWKFIFVLIFLIWGLVYMKWETLTPYYASLVAIGILVLEKNLKKSTFISFLDNMALVLVRVYGSVIPVGLIVNAFVIGGLSAAFTGSIVTLAGSNSLLLLLFGAIACYILGMVGLCVAAYLVLAVTIVPGLINFGFDTMASHFFIIYYSMLAGITPPVALTAFVAAGIANSDPMRTAIQSMKLAIVIYIIPLSFIYDQSILFKGPIINTFLALICSLAGIYFLSGALEGYFPLLSKDENFSKVSYFMRPLLFIMGILLILPFWRIKVLVLSIFVIVIYFIIKYNQRKEHKV